MYAGIDYSMSSPGLVVGNSSNPDELMYYGFRQKKKQVSTKPNIILMEYPEYTCNEERYLKLASIFVEILKKNDVKKVWLEGYAYGATGNVFNVGENTGVLKNLLWLAGIEFEAIAPNVAKKYLTGKGNANKTAMFESYIAKTGHQLDKLIDDERKGDKIPSPVHDLIDAYTMLQVGISNCHS